MLKKISAVAWLVLFSLTPLSAQEENIRFLINQFGDEDPFVNGEAILALAAAGEQTVDSLLPILAKGDDNARRCAAIALHKIAPRGKQAIPALTGALNDSSSHVRWCSALALAKFGADAADAAAELGKLLHDPDNNVRWAAYIALSAIDRVKLNQPPTLAEVTGRIEKMAPKFMSTLHVPGVAIALIRESKTIWTGYFGLADASRGIKVDASTMFEVCSMSKPVFAFLALKMVEEGVLDLDRPLYDYLPEEFIADDSDFGRMVTARRALAHCSGMPNWRKGGEERIGPLPIYFRPGSRFGYSGEGIYYLQRVVERLCGEPLQELAQKQLFSKLGLRSTSYIWREELDGQFSAGHDSAGQCLEASRYHHANASYTLRSTAEEYARLLTAIVRPAQQENFLLSEEMRKEMLSHQIRVDSREVMDRPGRHLGLAGFRGLGWAVDSTITHDVAQHTGSNQSGFRCYTQLDVEDGSGMVILTNALNGDELYRRLIAAIGDF